MIGEDLSSSRLAAPPFEPLPADAITRDLLVEFGTRIDERAWTAGLDSWSWGTGVGLLGSIRFSEAIGAPFPSLVLGFLDRHIARGVTVQHVNDLAPGTAAVFAAQATGDRRYLDLAEGLAAWTRTASRATRSAGGALEHWPGGVWADTAFMAGVFLGHLGRQIGDAELLTEAGRQVLAHAAVLQDPESGLCAHGSHRDETIWCFWGRGNAWLALAATEYLELATGAPRHQADLVGPVEAFLRRQLGALSECQPEHGVWDVLVDGQPECRGILETSAAAGIGAAMLRAGEVLPDLPAAVGAAGWRAVRGVLAHVAADGTLTRVSAGTILQLLPFGYSVIRDDRLQPWGQGLALLAIAAALRALERGEEDT